MIALDLLACPQCSGDLELLGGQLRCKSCARIYPIRGGVPRFVTSESYAESFGDEWTFFDRTQLDSAHGTGISYTRFKTLSPIAPEDLRGRNVLEAGCGMGRFLEIVGMAGAATVVGVDITRAVDSAARNTASLPNVCVVQGDLFSAPVAKQAFDYIYSFGVIHHTGTGAPDAVKSLAAHLKPGGRLCVWVYTRRGGRRLPTPDRVYGAAFRRLPHKAFLTAMRWYAQFALLLRSIPGVALIARYIFPIQDLRDKGPAEDGYDETAAGPVSKEFVREWAWLSAFDYFGPTYASRHTPEEVEGWLRDAGLVDIEHGIPVAVSGRKPE